MTQSLILIWVIVQTLTVWVIDRLNFSFQPPAFPEETPETIQQYIKDRYLLPQLDTDEFTPEKMGKQWEFDWFERAKILPEPSLPQTIIVPKWVPPFRRPKNPPGGRWEPESVEVCSSAVLCVFVFFFHSLVACRYGLQMNLFISNIHPS